MKWAYFNDGFIPEEACQLPAGDLVVQRGYGIFDFFKTLAGSPVFLEDHLSRFYQSAETMRLPVGKTAMALNEIIRNLIDKNGLADSGIRLTLTGGVSPDGYSLATPNLIITQQPLKRPAANAFETGLRLVTYAHQRQLPHVKTIDYLMPIWLQPWLAKMKGDDVLYHHNNNISECPRANFFIVTTDGRIATPAQHILKGIHRAKVLQLAGKKAVERVITLAEVTTAQEAFITSTTKQVLPVTAIDGRTIGDGTPGPVTRLLAEQSETLIQKSITVVQPAS